ncbi:PhzF family phenazine biosynthesis isomerase [bacterium]|nr:PhzF family phenazine biosynthesis isomerase [bacterium]
MECPFYQIDAFAERAFGGGPAAVMPLDAFLEDRLMQAIAAENNLAETAFLVPKGEGVWDLRWFTPTIEVPLCGHATLAAAHAIFSHEGFMEDEIAFDTKSGRLTVKRLSDNRLVMDFPAQTARAIAPPPGLADALRAEPVEVMAAAFLLVIFENASKIRALAPDISALKEIGGATDVRAGNVICAAPGDDGYDVVSRFFGPGSGIPEDPATGSAHCIIAPEFSRRLGKDDLRCFQAYPGRGADITTQIKGDRVLLSGRGRTVIEGVFTL